MEQQDRIEVENCCTHYQIEISFFDSLEDAGLINVQMQEGRRYIAHDDLNLLEKFIRLHYDLKINTEGLEAIYHMLERMRQMQEELALMRRRFEDLNKPQFS
jgi:hypothetical protein